MALKGDVQIQRQPTTINAKVGAPIFESDTIKTHARSKVQVQLKDETTITVGPNSEYFFEAFNNSNDPHIAMRIKRGFFKAVSGKIGKLAPKRFSIKTNSATIGIRGTHFMAFIDNDMEQIACTKGAITIETLSHENFLVTAGNMITYAQNVWHVQPLDLNNFTPLVHVKRASLRTATITPLRTSIATVSNLALEERVNNVITTLNALTPDIDPSSPVPPVVPVTETLLNLTTTTNTDPIIPAFTPQ